jgi:hypothetical protein
VWKIDRESGKFEKLPENIRLDPKSHALNEETGVN